MYQYTANRSVFRCLQKVYLPTAGFLGLYTVSVPMEPCIIASSIIGVHGVTVLKCCGRVVHSISCVVLKCT